MLLSATCILLQNIFRASDARGSIGSRSGLTVMLQFGYFISTYCATITVKCECSQETHLLISTEMINYDYIEIIQDM